MKATLFADAYSTVQAMKENALDRVTEKYPENSYKNYMDQIEHYSFPQTWPSTSLGFGGVGGQALTTAQTDVFVFNDAKLAVIYWAGRFAYTVDFDIRPEFWDEMSKFQTPDLRFAKKNGWVLE